MLSSAEMETDRGEGGREGGTEKEGGSSHAAVRLLACHTMPSSAVTAAAAAATRYGLTVSTVGSDCMKRRRGIAVFGALWFIKW